GTHDDQYARLSFPAFTSDGRPFCVRRSPRQFAAALHPLEKTTPDRPLMGWGGELIAHLSFAPDGSHLAARGEYTVRVWRLNDAGGVPHLEGRGNGVHWCDFLPDGRLLTFSRRDSAVKLWPADLFRPLTGD